MKPLIGITPLIDEKKDSFWMLPEYMKALEMAGALPVMLPLTDAPDMIEQIAETFDGFLFSGGHDIAPACYGEDCIPECGIAIPERDSMEHALFAKIVKTEKPILGICRGLQFLNVALGGTLYQDIAAQYPTEINHVMKQPYNQAIHKVSILPDTPFAKLISVSELGVNTRHHQAIKELAPHLKAGAISEDGLVEGVFMPDKKFVVGVQWHPEHALDAEMYSMNFFRSFVDACR